MAIRAGYPGRMGPPQRGDGSVEILNLGMTSLPSYLTFTRASTKNVFNSAGLLTSLSTDVPGFDTNPATLQPRGLLLEGARTNIALHNRDLTQAAWVKTNCTATRNAIGIDGASNSATTLAATAGNATCLQSVTLVSSQRFQSAYVRRVSGTGTVEMTTDGGTTWTPITITSSWARYSVPAQTVTNPQFGFRIVSSGDSIAVDYVQNEGGAFASSPILVEGVSATRAADVATLTNLANIAYNATQGSVYSEFEAAFAQPGNTGVYSFDAGASSNLIDLLSTSSTQINGRLRNGAVTTASIAVSGYAANTTIKHAFGFTNNSAQAALNGVLGTEDTSCTMPTVDRLRLGTTIFVAGGEMFIWLRRFTYYTVRLNNSQLQALTV